MVTSHSLRELEDTCDQLALLHRGGVVLESDVGNLKTSLFKIQVAFPQEYDHSLFDGLELVHFTKRGSVSTLSYAATGRKRLNGAGLAADRA